MEPVRMSGPLHNNREKTVLPQGSPTPATPAFMEKKPNRPPSRPNVAPEDPIAQKLSDRIMPNQIFRR